MFENTEVAFRHKSGFGLLRAYVLFKLIAKPKRVEFLRKITRLSAKLHLPVGWAVKPTLYKHFVGGETLQKCNPAVDTLIKYRVKSILDYSVEGRNEIADMDRTLEETLHSIENAASNPAITFVVFKPTAFATEDTLYRATTVDAYDPIVQARIKRFRNYVDTICKKAYELNVPVLIDAEHSWYQSFLDIVIEEMMEKYNKMKVIVFNTLQMYRLDRVEYLYDVISRSVKYNFFLGIKLVRGAYMEQEWERADRLNLDPTVYSNRHLTDASFTAGLRLAMQHISRMVFFCGSHNEESNQLVMDLMKQYGLKNNDYRVWFSQLYGMSDHISFNLAAQGYNVAKYIPYGPVENILPYLFRRAEENTAIAGQTGRELRLIRTEMARRWNQRSKKRPE